MDWDATWRNWVRNTKAVKPNPYDVGRLTVPSSNEPDPALEKIKADGLPIYFDPASVGAMKDVADKELHNWFSMMDVLFLNEEESIYLTGSVDIERALNYMLDFSQVVVIKRGSAGAIAKARGFDSISLPAVAATVVDTTGAGDSFAAGFIASYSKNHDLTAALQAGGELAAGCVAIVGGRPRVGTAI